jgi:gamma-glutamylputrescine oxidase
MTGALSQRPSRRTRPVLVCREPAARPERPPLQGDVTADVAILGAGFTGLWAALTLARAGRRVVVLDAHRVGFGASGRNGGQVNLGFNKSQQGARGETGRKPAPAPSGTLPKRRAGSCATSARPTRPRPPTAPARPSPNTRPAPWRSWRRRPISSTAATGSRYRGDGPRGLFRAGEIAALRRRRDGPGRRAPAAPGLCTGARPGGRGGGRHDPRAERGDRIDRGPPRRPEDPRGPVTAPHAIIAGNGYLPDILPP